MGIVGPSVGVAATAATQLVPTSGMNILEPPPTQQSEHAVASAAANVPGSLLRLESRRSAVRSLIQAVGFPWSTRASANQSSLTVRVSGSF